MKLRTKNIVVRDFERKDIDNLYHIVREEYIYKFMPDWKENSDNKDNLFEYVDWLQTQKDSKDVIINKRYAISLPDTDEMVGMVGMGLENNLNEVEMAYFISEKYRGYGYTKEAVNALAEWCFSVSDIKYLILTIDCANIASCKLAEKCGFKLFEKRTPIGHKQSNMKSDSYYYYRKWREGFNDMI